MAKRKRAYGSTKAVHREGAGALIQDARWRASQVRAELDRGDCVKAFDRLGMLNRLVGKAQRDLSHARGGRAGSARGGGGLWGVARSLQNKWLMKCMR